MKNNLIYLIIFFCNYLGAQKITFINKELNQDFQNKNIFLSGINERITFYTYEYQNVFDIYGDSIFYSKKSTNIDSIYSKQKNRFLKIWKSQDSMFQIDFSFYTNEKDSILLFFKGVQIAEIPVDIIKVPKASFKLGEGNDSLIYRNNLKLTQNQFLSLSFPGIDHILQAKFPHGNFDFYKIKMYSNQELVYESNQIYTNRIHGEILDKLLTDNNINSFEIFYVGGCHFGKIRKFQILD